MLTLPPLDLFQVIQNRMLEAYNSEFWHDLVEKSPGVKWTSRSTFGGGCPICGSGYCVRAGGEVELGSDLWRQFSLVIGWTPEEVAVWMDPEQRPMLDPFDGEDEEDA